MGGRERDTQGVFCCCCLLICGRPAEGLVRLHVLDASGGVVKAHCFFKPRGVGTVWEAVSL